MRYRLTLAFAYAALAIFITGTWLFVAKTETFEDGFSSIVKLADGSAPVPFVKRRLVPEMAQALAAAIPASVWDQVRQTLAGSAPLLRPIHAFLDQQQWRPENYPILFSATLLIGLSVLGFLYSARALIHRLYETTPRLADVVAGVLGLGLLGGSGWHYQSYPYDLPLCFLFTLTFVGMIGRRWWFCLPFAAACYCKETSVLLILGWFLLADNWRSWRTLAVGAALASGYLAARWWIDSRFPSPPGQFWGAFWYPGRNAKVLAANLLFYAWTLPFVAVCFYRMLRLWPDYPRPLRRLLWLGFPLLAIGFVRGIFEEKRQYLELLPVFGLLTAHWVVHEFGLGDRWRTREQVGQARSA